MSRSALAPLGASLGMSISVAVAALVEDGPIQWKARVFVDGGGSSQGGEIRVRNEAPRERAYAGDVRLELGSYTVRGNGRGARPQPGELPFALGVEVTDIASGRSGTLTRAGYFVGDLDAPGSVGVRFGEREPAPGLTLGDNFYTLTHFFLFPPDDSSDSGTIHADVEVRPALVETPEPCTLALAGLGLAGAGLAGRRRRGAGHRPA